jgi:glutathione S-transferase
VDPAQREQALALQRDFDDEVGPLVRRAVFADLLREPDYLCGMFASRRGRATRALYRAAFPLLRGRMKASMGIAGPDSIAQAIEGTRRALERVAKQAGASGYLVGDRFSVADLAAAALLAPIANPPDSPMTRPEPMPGVVRAGLERFADHAGTAWVRDIYRRHRPPSSELAGAG